MDITIIGTPSDPFLPPTNDTVYDPLSPEAHSFDDEFFGCVEWFDDQVTYGELDLGYDSWKETTYYFTEFGIFSDVVESTVQGTGVTTDTISFNVHSNTDAFSGVLHIDHSRAVQGDTNETWITTFSMGGQNVGSTITTWDDKGVKLYRYTPSGGTVLIAAKAYE